MHYTYRNSSYGRKSTCNSLEDFPNNEIDRWEISEREVIRGVQDRVNKLCLMHDIMKYIIVSASHAVDRRFAPRPGHNTGHYKMAQTVSLLGTQA